MDAAVRRYKGEGLESLAKPAERVQEGVEIFQAIAAVKQPARQRTRR